MFVCYVQFGNIHNREIALHNDIEYVCWAQSIDLHNPLFALHKASKHGSVLCAIHS